MESTVQNRSLWGFSTILLLSFALSMSSCGARQYNGKLKKSTATHDALAGPFYSAGQNGNSMSTATCGSLTGRPCARARASVGMPYHFDVNANTAQAPIQTGTVYPASGPYAGAVGAGYTKGTTQKAGNKDLSTMKKQASPGQIVFP